MDTLQIDLKKSSAALPSVSEDAARISGRDYRKETQVVFEPVTTDLYKLSYACLIIPKFPAHRLAGDLAQELPEMMYRISQSYTWRMEGLIVDPDYLQWILHVDAQTSSAAFMRIIRKHTSDLIFGNFPALKELNLSKDFWAPGYFVIISSQPHPAHMVTDFIRMTRRQQGF